MNDILKHLVAALLALSLTQGATVPVTPTNPAPDTLPQAGALWQGTQGTPTPIPMGGQ